MDLCRDEFPLRSVSGEKLLVLVCPVGVSEAETDQHRHEAGEAERRNGAPQGNGGNQPVAVGLEQQSTKRGALEDCLDL